LVINKVDRPDARIDEVVNHAFDLFVDLGANEVQADFPIFYACARQGWCTQDRDQVDQLLNGSVKGSLQPLFDGILKEVPAPKIAEGKGPTDFSMLISNLS